RKGHCLISRLEQEHLVEASLRSGVAREKLFDQSSNCSVHLVTILQVERIVRSDINVVSNRQDGGDFGFNAFTSIKRHMRQAWPTAPPGLADILREVEVLPVSSRGRNDHGVLGRCKYAVIFEHLN